MCGRFAGSTMTAPADFRSSIAGRTACSTRLVEGEVAGDAEPGALQPAGVEERGVVGVEFAGAGRGGARRAGRRRRRRRAAMAASRTVRAIGPAVSCECEIGMMPARLHRPDRRLDPDDAVDRRRAHDRAAGLGADGQRREVGRTPRCPIRSSTRRDCGRARRDCGTARRGRSSRCWPACPRQ